MTAPVLLDPPKDPPQWPSPWRPTHTLPHHPGCAALGGSGGVNCTPCDINDDWRINRAADI